MVVVKKDVSAHAEGKRIVVPLFLPRLTSKASPTQVKEMRVLP
jgi:hypothetical protein